jgi:hypothetical protein
VKRPEGKKNTREQAALGRYAPTRKTPVVTSAGAIVRRLCRSRSALLYSGIHDIDNASVVDPASSLNQTLERSYSERQKGVGSGRSPCRITMIRCISPKSDRRGRPEPQARVSAPAAVIRCSVIGLPCTLRSGNAPS